MRRVFNVIILTLAVNFLALAGAAWYLWRSGKIDGTKAVAIREIVFPKPTTQPTPDAARGGTSPTTRPFVQLDALLARHAGKRAGEQVELIQQTFDAQTAMLDRRKRELDALQAQVAVEQRNLAEASAALDADRQQLAARDAEAQATASDKGFQDSLKLYGTMPGKQAKAVFMALPDETVVRYLRAMQPRAASKILREFKAPEEQERLNRLMELMRLAQPATQPAPSAAQPARGA